MTANPRAHRPVVATWLAAWLATIAVALALTAACCERDVPLGVSPAGDAAAADGGAGG